MTKPTHFAAAVAMALALTVPGCARSPRVSFYTLAPGSAALAPVPVATAPSVVVGPVTLPEVVDRPQLVVRVADNRVDLLESHRWAEPLKSEIPRVMARELGRLLGSRQVASHRENAVADAEYRVLVDITRLELVPGDSVLVEAGWSLRRKGGTRRSGHPLIKERIGGAGYQAMVAATGRALAAVSGDIAREIRAETGTSR